MESIKCKYCGGELSKVAMSPMSDWNVEYMWICMNDECDYYTKGWDWMWNRFKVMVSYRYYYNPFHKTDGPFPVTKSSDLKDSIIQ